MSEIKKAIDLLKSGDVVALPTETVYGLAASIESRAGIDKIFATKERPFFDPLIVHVSSVAQAKEYTTEWNEVCDLLAEKFWPGPLTFILKKNDSVSSKITSGYDTVGIRMPNQEQTLNIINELGHPIAAPSANKFKKISPTTAQHVRDEFPQLHIVDGGPAEVGIESTIIRIKDNKVCIYRPGMISLEMIKQELKNNNFDNITVEYVESPVAPGHLKHHYMPKIPIILCLDLYTNDYSLAHIPMSLLQNRVMWKVEDDAALVARTMYAKFKEFDSKDYTAIIVLIKEELFKADHFQGIVNRLVKAASYYLPEEISNKS